MFSQIGPMEIVLVLVVALLILGPKRLPDAGRSLGSGLREFKDSLTTASQTATPETPPADEHEQTHEGQLASARDGAGAGTRR